MIYRFHRVELTTFADGFSLTPNGRRPLLGERSRCLACGKTWDGPGPLPFVDSCPAATDEPRPTVTGDAP